MRLRFWSQNLTKNHEYDLEKSILRHGRGGFWIYDSNEQKLAHLGAEWMYPTTHCQISISTGEEKDFDIGFACWLFAIWIFIDVLPYGWIKGRLPHRELSLSIHDGALWWKLWQLTMEWHSNTPRWLDGNFSPIDFIFGRAKYSEQTLLVEEDNRLYMPEADYPVTVRIFRSTWKRPRWPWKKMIIRSHIKFLTSVPIPGKGENSYDCDEDAYYGMTLLAESVDEALGKAIVAIYERRRKYGGRGWLLEKAKTDRVILRESNGDP